MKQPSDQVARRRLRVLMLCAHEPTLDPRIHWEALGAAARFEVTVVGFNREDGSLPEVERRDGYEIRRLRRSEGGILRYGWRLMAVMDPAMRIALLALLLAFAPLAILAGLLLRVGLAVYRSAKKELLEYPWAQSLRGRLIRRVRQSRLLYVYMVLRTQFAPAANLFWPYIESSPFRPDVVHCNDLDTLLAGALAKKRFNCRVVYDAHEYFPHSDPEGGWIDRTVFDLLERRLIRHADAVVTVNHLLAEVMEQAYGVAPIHSVPNAEPWHEPHGQAPRPALRDVAAGRVAFLFQGRFSPGRGVEELIAAWAKVDGSKAALFLRGPHNPWRDELMAMAAQQGVLGRSVYFVEAVKEEDLVQAAREADVGIISYKGDVAGYKYACPNKLSQYLHAGLFVLTNDLPYVRQVLEEAGAGLHYSSQDISSIVRAVERIVLDPDLMRRGSANALRYAREKFNWQVFSQTLYALYQPADAEAVLNTEPHGVSTG